MNGYAILAFVVTPLLVMALGWGAVIWHERDASRAMPKPPGE